jgi:hypothetical protein
MNKILTPFKFVFDDFEVFRALFLVFYREMKSNFSYWMYFYSRVFYFKTLVSYDLRVLLDFTGLTSKLINLIGFDFNSYVFDINFVSVNFLRLFLSLPYCWLLFNTVINKLVINGYSADFFLRNSKVMAVSAAKSTLGSFSQLVGI